MSEKYLIVSLGSIGLRHLRNLRRIKPQAKIGILHLSGRTPDSIPDGADCVFSTVDDARAFSPSAAIICSPATTHLQVARILLSDGIPLLIEKPLAETTMGLAELIELSVNRNIPLMTGYNLRFYPSLIEVRRLLASGAIGEVIGVRAEVGQYLPDWRPGMRYQNSVSAQRTLGGGVLLELSHEIDYIYWLFGAPRRVFAMGGRFSGLDIDVEDMASLCLEYEAPRRLVNIHLDFLQRSVSRTCKFIGSEGTLIWNGISEHIDLYRSESGQWSRLEIPSVPDKNAMYLSELSHFLQAVETRAVPAIDGYQGCQVLHIVEAAKQSMERGVVVELS